MMICILYDLTGIHSTSLDQCNYWPEKNNIPLREIALLYNLLQSRYMSNILIPMYIPTSQNSFFAIRYIYISIVCTYR